MKLSVFKSYMDKDSIRPRYVHRKEGGLHPAVDRKWLIYTRGEPKET